MGTSTAPVVKGNTPPSWSQTVVAQLKDFGQRLSAQESLLKTLEQPASKVGMSPQDFLGQATEGGHQAVVFTPDGRPMTVPKNQRGAPRIAGWGQYLKDLQDMHSEKASPSKREQARNRLIEQKVEAVYGLGDGTNRTINKTALAEASGLAGGYTIPPQFVHTILLLAIEDAIVRPRASIQPMTSLTMQIPSLDYTTVQGAGKTPFTGGVVASWTAEAATRQESEPQFRQTELKAHELSFFSVASNTLLQDSVVALDALLTQLFSMAISWYTDYAFLQGSGTGQPLGILNAPAAIAVTKTTAAHFVYQDVANMFANFLYGGGWRSLQSSCWVIHPKVLQDLLIMNDRSGSSSGSGLGRFAFIPFNMGAQELPGESSGPFSIGYLAGLPVLVSEKVPALGTNGCVMLMDLSKYLLGDRSELLIDVSPHVNFTKNQMTWRVIWRGDGQPWLNNAITLADGTWTASPFVYLTQ